MIRAGRVEEINSDSGRWLILDIGFANNAQSCGLLVDLEPPVELRFGTAVKKICDEIRGSVQPVNLVIEAPLSVSFDHRGNPKGRSVEKQGGKTRYWYVGLGCTVMVAATYLVRAISEIDQLTEVRLFEGFVSFKDSTTKSDHSRDVMLLREIIDSPEDYSEAVVRPERLKIDSSDNLQSAFLVAGIDAGIPPILIRDGS